jgi:hypothetical protein
VAEYENLSAAYPTERQSLLALMAAGRIALKRLNQPSNALLLQSRRSFCCTPPQLATEH